MLITENIYQNSSCEKKHNQNKIMYNFNRAEIEHKQTKGIMMRALPHLFVRCFILVLALLIAGSTVTAQDSPNLIGAFFVKGKVGLKWSATSGATEYNIYRQEGAGEFQKIGSTAKTNHFDTEISSGVSYTYKIAAVVGGNEVFGDTKTVNIPAGAGGGFKAPTGLTGRFDPTGIYLKWDRVQGAIAYNVYRSDTPDGTFDVVGNASSYKHIDKDGLVHGSTYYYKVNAMNEEFEETEFSKTIEVKFGLSDEDMAALRAQQDTITLVDINVEYLKEITEAEPGNKLSDPTDIVFNSKGDMYLVDKGNFRVVCYDSQGNYKFDFGERVPKGYEENAPDGTFFMPMSIDTDKQDNVYVSDIGLHAILVFTPDGKYLRKIKVDNKQEEDSKQFRPNGIVVLDDGRIISTDAGLHRFLILSPDGQIQLERKFGLSGSDSLYFLFPGDVMVTKDSVICVVDIMNSRIQEFDMKGNFIRAFGDVGQSAGFFGRPGSIAEDGKGQLWISDIMGHTIQQFDPIGNVISAIGNQMFEGTDVSIQGPRGIIIKDNKFYVVSRLSNKVYVFDIKG